MFVNLHTDVVQSRNKGKIVLIDNDNLKYYIKNMISL